MPYSSPGSAPERDTEKETLERMVAKAKRIADVITGFTGDVRVISHHDADGICSAAIMTKALVRQGMGFRLSFIKQLYEEDIKELGKENNRLLIFLDLGSGQLESIQEFLIKDGTRAVISDHHRVQGEVVSDGVLQLNPTDFGINENISGSGTTYIIARAMNPENRDLSELAVIGAIGDSQMGSIGSDWGLLGLNKEILKDAEITGKISKSRGLRLWGRTTRPIHKALEYSVDPYIPGISGSESGAVHFLQELGINPRDENGEWKTLSGLTNKEVKMLTTGIIKERIRGNRENPDWVFGEVYDLLDKGGMKDANEFATILNSAGKQDMGYVGVALCLNDKEYFPLVGGLLERYRREIGKSLKWVGKNMEKVRRTGNANYMLAGDRIPENVVSNVVSIMHRSGILPETEKDKPIFAFVSTERGDVKVSARLSDDAVNAGLSLQEIVSEAASEAGGEGGGHAGAAGANIPSSSEERFINRAEELLSTHGKGLEAAAEKETEAENGTAESEGEAGSEEGREAEGQHGPGREDRKGSREKTEGEGLVRYLGS